MDTIDYAGLRKEQAEKRERGELMGIGISSFTEIVGAGPSHDFDILGHQDVRLVRDPGPSDRQGPRPDRRPDARARATRRRSPRSSPRSSASRSQDIKIEYGDTDTAPYGLGTYASRSTPVAGAATAIASRKIQAKARTLAAHLLEASEDDLEWEPGKFSVKGSPGPVQDDPGDRLRGVHQPSGRDGGRPRGGRLLRPAEPDLPVRQLHLRRRHRQGHRARSTSAASSPSTTAATSSTR